MNRRGQSESDLAIFAVIIFIIMILGVVVLKSWNGIDAGMQSKASIIGSTAATASSDAATGFGGGFNGAVIVAIGIMYMGLFVSSRHISTHPALFFINVVLVVASLSLSAIFANVFDQGTNTANFVTERAAMPALVFVGNNLLYFGIGALAMILLGLFAKPGGGIDE